MLLAVLVASVVTGFFDESGLPNGSSVLLSSSNGDTVLVEFPVKTLSNVIRLEQQNHLNFVHIFKMHLIFCHPHEMRF